MSIFLCQKCDSWFDTYAELRKHMSGCKGKPKQPVVPKSVPEPEASTIDETQDSVEDVISETPSVEPEVATEETFETDEPVEEAFDRKDAIKALKKSGVDGRSLSKKSDEEIKEIYDETFGGE